MLRTAITIVFSITLFIGASLLFIIEPMIAKMILPLLGGTPAVWNTCMMFFQIMLLAGYGYAHIISTKTGTGKQILIQSVILLLAFIVLPVGISHQLIPSGKDNPISSVLLILLVSVGLPFFVLSSTAPLLQKWFAGTDHPSSKDPYFLYSASNTGSMLALISYPTIIEPRLALAEQSRFWMAGYLILGILTLCCAYLTWKSLSVCLTKDKAQNSHELAEQCRDDNSSINFKDRSFWTILAFVPSSLMLGATTYLTTDIAAIPLLWVIPLCLYLLSFIIVFAKQADKLHRIMIHLLPVTLTILIFLFYADTKMPKWPIFILHLINLFIVSMVCHGEIAKNRPSAKNLTEFYLWMSFGGALGGIFNALIAPLAFRTIAEYPVALFLSALLLPVYHIAGRQKPADGISNKKMQLIKWSSIGIYAGLSIFIAILSFWLITKWPIGELELDWISESLNIETETIESILTYGIIALICFSLVFLKKRFLFGVGIGIFIFSAMTFGNWNADIAYQERSFFGVLTVSKESGGRFMRLAHGTTQHGKQGTDPEMRREPLTYYHREGPVGDVFSELSRTKNKRRIAVIGLGIGTLASYGKPGQEFDFYEIDPLVKQIAANPELFTYLQECRAAWKVILGDARLKIEKAPNQHYDLIVLDAFTSDAIPVHLLTKEAFSLYLSKLNKHGLLIVHISNKYLNLQPVLEKLSADAGLVSLVRDDNEDKEKEKYGSTWVLLSRRKADIGRLAHNKNWKDLEKQQYINTWTDDFSNILSVFKWHRSKA